MKRNSMVVISMVLLTTSFPTLSENTLTRVYAGNTTDMPTLNPKQDFTLCNIYVETSKAHKHNFAALSKEQLKKYRQFLRRKSDDTYHFDVPRQFKDRMKCHICDRNTGKQQPGAYLIDGTSRITTKLRDFYAGTERKFKRLQPLQGADRQYELFLPFELQNLPEAQRPYLTKLASTGRSYLAIPAGFQGIGKDAVVTLYVRNISTGKLLQPAAYTITIHPVATATSSSAQD